MHDPDDYVSIYTPPLTLDASRTCLVIVDLMYATGHPDFGLGRLLKEQGRLDEADYRFHRIAEKVVPNTLRLLAWARECGMRRIFLTYGSEVSDYSDLGPQVFELCRATRNRVGNREHELLDELARRDDERVVNKLTASAFSSSPLELVLRTYGCETLLFTGVSTNMCVEGTLRDASDRGFGCVLVEDACGADSEVYHEATCTVVQRLYGHVVRTQEIIDRLESEPATVEARAVVS
jgi:nicotinamidase-related amidase